MLIGGWARRRSLDFGPFFVYAAVLFAFSALVSAVHVPGGTFIHSAVALAPHSYILALEGIVVAVGWIAARRPAWDRGRRAIRVFGGADDRVRDRSPRSPARWSSTRPGPASRDRVPSRWRTRWTRPARRITDRVMSIDASGTRYWTGHGGVVLVNDPLDTIEEVARAYDIRWLVLDRDDAWPAVAPILDGVAAGLARAADPGTAAPDRAGGLPRAGARRDPPARRSLSARRDVRRRARRPRRTSRPRSSSRSRRTRPTTSAWRATCSRAAGLV